LLRSLAEGLAFLEAVDAVEAEFSLCAILTNAVGSRPL